MFAVVSKYNYRDFEWLYKNWEHISTDYPPKPFSGEGRSGVGNRKMLLNDGDELFL